MLHPDNFEMESLRLFETPSLPPFPVPKQPLRTPHLPLEHNILDRVAGFTHVDSFSPKFGFGPEARAAARKAHQQELV